MVCHGTLWLRAAVLTLELILGQVEVFQLRQLRPNESLRTATTRLLHRQVRMIIETLLKTVHDATERYSMSARSVQLVEEWLRDVLLCCCAPEGAEPCRRE